MKVENMLSLKGNKIANQFIIRDRQGLSYDKYFQSYDSIIVKIYIKEGDTEYSTELDEHYWDYSKTTSKYRNLFLCESTKEIKAKIKSGEYKLVDLN